MGRNRPENPWRRVRPRVEREDPAPAEQVQQDICWKLVPGLPYDTGNTSQVRSYHVRSGITGRIAKEPDHLLRPIDDPQTEQQVVALGDGIGSEVTAAVDYLDKLIFELPERVAAKEFRPQLRLTGPRAEILRIEQDLRRIFYQSRSRF